ncbi:GLYCEROLIPASE A1 [Salix viminalis]|uniref:GLYCEROLIPASE A1 n=1 Tax=Salix viminalis TaxID=40686 RepID=A0A9Q0TNN9_SALVM|nr:GLYCEROLIPASE A1 [Salix viminalis]
MAMQISSAVPAQNFDLFRRPSFKRQRSTLKLTSSVTRSLKSVDTSSSPTELTKKHLANLDQLLQKQIPEPINQAVSQPTHRVSNKGSLANNRGKNLLEDLNLARIWSETKSAEEMSPRHLNRLRRLLSMTEEYSPRNHLGSRWREYHGSNDWDGLLDPLDENLRREVVRYGEFVQAAYHAFHSNPAMSAGKPPLPQQVSLPDRSYKVTKSLYGTSSVGLPKWVDDVAPDLGWMTQRSSWIGYVAETMTRLKSNPRVECGFLSLYKTDGVNVPSLAESVVEEVKRLIELYKGENLSITVTGHSLGAALALLVGDELSSCAPRVPPIAVFSFGGPRVGNRGFANQMTAKKVKVLRIVNNQDVITRVPGIPMVEELNDSMPLAYAHVGTELRVDTRTSPYLKPNADVACCHDLEAYLHLVDGFMASNCPFRANAKRSLVKLLNEQGSNVKRLYTSKARALSSLNFERQGLAASGCLPSPS